MCVGVSGSCNFALRWQCCIWLEKQPLAADMKGQVIVIAHRIVYLLFSYLPLVIVMSKFCFDLLASAKSYLGRCASTLAGYNTVVKSAY